MWPHNTRADSKWNWWQICSVCNYPRTSKNKDLSKKLALTLRAIL